MQIPAPPPWLSKRNFIFKSKKGKRWNKKGEKREKAKLLLSLCNLNISIICMGGGGRGRQQQIDALRAPCGYPPTQYSDLGFASTPPPNLISEYLIVVSPFRNVTGSLVQDYKINSYPRTIFTSVLQGVKGCCLWIRPRFPRLALRKCRKSCLEEVYKLGTDANLTWVIKTIMPPPSATLLSVLPFK